MSGRPKLKQCPLCGSKVSLENDVMELLCKELERLRKEAPAVQEEADALRKTLRQIRDDILDMIRNDRSEDPDSYAHGLLLSIGGACEMALHETKNTKKGENND